MAFLAADREFKTRAFVNSIVTKNSEICRNVRCKPLGKHGPSSATKTSWDDDDDDTRTLTLRVTMLTSYKRLTEYGSVMLFV